MDGILARGAPVRETKVIGLVPKVTVGLEARDSEDTKLTVIVSPTLAMVETELLEDTEIEEKVGRVESTVEDESEASEVRRFPEASYPSIFTCKVLLFTVGTIQEYVPEFG